MSSDGKVSDNPPSSQGKGEKVAENKATSGVQGEAEEARTREEVSEARKRLMNERLFKTRLPGG